jgi:hypothetical protein
VLGLAAAGCATPPKPTVTAAEAFGVQKGDLAPEQAANARAQATEARAPQRKLVAPDKWARGFVRPGECEAAAVTIAEDSGRELGWTYLKACAARTDFGLLKRLLENWTPELRSKPEASTVLAGVIANRGGLVKTDLMTIQQRRLPLFEVSAAVRQPEAFRGRYLVFVGRIEKLKSAKGRTEMVLAEAGRIDEDTVVFAAGGYGSVSSSSGSGAVTGSYSSSSRSGNVTGSSSGTASASGSYASSDSYRAGRLERRGMTTFEDTGQKIITRLAGADPYLSVDRTFVFLVRFEGARALADDTADDEEPKLTAMVSLVSYHDVSAVGAFDQ